MLAEHKLTSSQSTDQSAHSHPLPDPQALLEVNGNWGQPPKELDWSELAASGNGTSAEIFYNSGNAFNPGELYVPGWEIPRAGGGRLDSSVNLGTDCLTVDPKVLGDGPKSMVRERGHDSRSRRYNASRQRRERVHTTHYESHNSFVYAEVISQSTGLEQHGDETNAPEHLLLQPQQEDSRHGSNWPDSSTIVTHSDRHLGSRGRQTSIDQPSDQFINATNARRPRRDGANAEGQNNPHVCECGRSYARSSELK